MVAGIVLTEPSLLWHGIKKSRNSTKWGSLASCLSSIPMLRTLRQYNSVATQWKSALSRAVVFRVVLHPPQLYFSILIFVILNVFDTVVVYRQKTDSNQLAHPNRFAFLNASFLRPFEHYTCRRSQQGKAKIERRDGWPEQAVNHSRRFYQTRYTSALISLT